jgi:hypothetical protein
MKSSYLRSGATALACALALSACGGSSGQLLLGGQVYGLTKETLVLQNNNAHDYSLTPGALGPSGEFYFPDLVGVDEQYNVTVKSFPSNVEKCTVTNGSGRSAFNVTTVRVVCELKTHALGGSVTGMSMSSPLVLVNGTDKVTVNPTSTPTVPVPFSMTKVGEDQNYGITVLTQPADRVCSVANASGTMGTGDVANVTVTCAPRG